MKLPLGLKKLSKYLGFFGLFSFILTVALIIFFREGIAQEFFGGEGIKVDKKDSKWLEKYCKELVTRFPPPPFTYTKKLKPAGMSTTLYIRSIVPKDKLKNAEMCGIGYEFSERQAYDEMNVEYKFEIKYTNAFHEAVDRAYTQLMTVPQTKTLPFGIMSFKDKKSVWLKQMRLSDKDAGRASYMYTGFPLIFMRENKKLGVTEYAEVFFGVDYYINVAVFETKTN